MFYLETPTLCVSPSLSSVCYCLHQQETTDQHILCSCVVIKQQSREKKKSPFHIKQVTFCSTVEHNTNHFCRRLKCWCGGGGQALTTAAAATVIAVDLYLAWKNFCSFFFYITTFISFKEPTENHKGLKLCE